MWNAPAETVQIEVPRRLFQAMRWRPLNVLVVALTGVSISFCPLFLYWLGRDGVHITDWRVLTNFAVIFLIPGFVLVSFGAPVLLLAGKRSGLWRSRADDGGRTRSLTGQLLFFVAMAVVASVIWFLSAWLVK